jgi:hypothetical protein
LVRFIGTAKVPMTAWAQFAGEGRDRVLAALTVRPAIGNDGDAVGESRSAQHQLTPLMAAWCALRLNNHERSSML